MISWNSFTYSDVLLGLHDVGFEYDQKEKNNRFITLYVRPYLQKLYKFCMFLIIFFNDSQKFTNFNNTIIKT